MTKKTDKFDEGACQKQADEKSSKDRSNKKKLEKDYNRVRTLYAGLDDGLIVPGADHDAIANSRLAYADSLKKSLFMRLDAADGDVQRAYLRAARGFLAAGVYTGFEYCMKEAASYELSHWQGPWRYAHLSLIHLAENSGFAFDKAQEDRNVNFDLVEHLKYFRKTATFKAKAGEIAGIGIHIGAADVKAAVEEQYDGGLDEIKKKIPSDVNLDLAIRSMMAGGLVGGLLRHTSFRLKRSLIITQMGEELSYAGFLDRVILDDARVEPNRQLEGSYSAYRKTVVSSLR